MPSARGDGQTADDDLVDLVDVLGTKVASDEYPCLGARSVFQRGRATIRVYEALAAPETAALLLGDLAAFAAEVDPTEGFASFVATFRGPEITDEKHFERLLWTQLQAVADLDGTPWSPGVSANPSDDHFAFSAAGTPFFIVGLHPRASRIARRTDVPVLVFNLHEQFEAMRASGGYPRMRDMIRRRDVRLQGDVNPMLADHGEISEARQYSGRAVGRGWLAPFVAGDDPRAGRPGGEQAPEGGCPR
jgi:FPC/CPF motif-containing protein YcgG